MTCLCLHYVLLRVSIRPDKIDIVKKYFRFTSRASLHTFVHSTIQIESLTRTTLFNWTILIDFISTNCYLLSKNDYSLSSTRCKFRREFTIFSKHSNTNSQNEWNLWQSAEWQFVCVPFTFAWQHEFVVSRRVFWLDGMSNNGARKKTKSRICRTNLNA